MQTFMVPCEFPIMFIMDKPVVAITVFRTDKFIFVVFCEEERKL